MAPASGG
eukprot:CCRYP_000566-RC/>CCRYP_000566-RC protein AED:0.47 eAED:1.00 QI:0/-1/0/1/-1/0/1/0/7